MKKERLKAKLADIAELDSAVDRDAALHKLWLKVRQKGVRKVTLEKSLKRMITARDRTSVGEQLAEMFADGEYFVLRQGGKVRVGYWAVEAFNADGDTRKVLNLMTRADFALLMENEFIRVGNESEPASRLWLESLDRPTYLSVALDPTGTVSEDVLNLWQGFGVVPKHGDCQIILDHIFDVLCAGDVELYEYVMDWFALKVQNPTRVMGTMLVFRSGQGTGKGIILEDLMMRIFGQHGLLVDDAEQLTGKFNKHLANACYVFADEALFAGDKRAAQKLKRRVTGGTIAIEPKGIDSFSVASSMGIVAATNRDHAIQIDVDDRRVVVCEVADHRKDDTEYFKPLHDHIRGDGAAHFLQKMLDRDVSGFNPMADRVITEATLEQRARSLTGPQRWWASIVEDGELPKELVLASFSEANGEVDPIGTGWEGRTFTVSRQKVREVYEEWARGHGNERYNIPYGKAFWNQLRACGAFDLEVSASNTDRQVTIGDLPSQKRAIANFLRGAVRD
ncbi:MULTISPECIES: DUF5906 domain-containing protein [unclassified Ruegeria]|uniref:DUF5906 domain-containing protein n=1 Tax=unclassified Ruegeria TaxID=2625375 RepID=UPI0014921B85|nr:MULTISPECIES: DUF5906 domain-containing protein [unclassified Ruegeria]NOD36024.1 hypothetical protein [Ruegeria sp. HKCCD7296]NOE43417.1 hypothetical protein [Ruegeria sp. HKCCD7319]